VSLFVTFVLRVVQSGQIHYYNTRTHKRTSKDPRRVPVATPVAVEDDDAGNFAPAGLDLDLNLAFEPRRRSPVRAEEKKPRPAADHAKPQAAADREDAALAGAQSGGVEMVAAVCMRCHMLVMMCRACPSCPNCKFLHPTAGRRRGERSAARRHSLRVRRDDDSRRVLCRDVGTPR
jgi:hypothetical protein